MTPFYQHDSCTVYCGDCREVLKQLPDESVQCCVTSPPYWGLRDYGHAGQLGQESTPEQYTEHLVLVFEEVRRMLRGDGILWLNLGDSYARNGGTPGGGNRELMHMDGTQSRMCKVPNGSGLKPKDLIGIPWMVAFALRKAGWYLRQEIIWAKPNPMPESVTDRCTKSHEQIFLLSKSAHYYYDADAIAEPLAYGSIERLSQPNLENQAGSDRVPGKTNGNMKAVYREPYTGESTKDYSGGGAQDASATKKRIVDRILSGEITTRNKRSVWTVTTHGFQDAHFATFPPDLIKPCILAGCPIGGMVLDPFLGSGTTAMVANELGRKCIGVDLNPDYAALAVQRSNVTMGLPLTS